MRQSAARLNRAWLTVLGIVVLLAGLVGLVIGSGLLARVGRAAGLDLTRPARSNRLFGPETGSVLTTTWLAVLVGLAGLVVALLALAWLIAQLPRRNQAKPFRLHDDVETGLTRCTPGVLTEAVETETKALPGVQDASAVLRGTAERPDLTMKVTASDRTNLPRLLAALQNQVAANLGTALDTQVRRLGVQLEIDTVKTKTDRITVTERVDPP